MFLGSDSDPNSASRSPSPDQGHKVEENDVDVDMNLDMASYFDFSPGPGLKNDNDASVALPSLLNDANVIDNSHPCCGCVCGYQRAIPLELPSTVAAAVAVQSEIEPDITILSPRPVNAALASSIGVLHDDLSLSPVLVSERSVDLNIGECEDDLAVSVESIGEEFYAFHWAGW